MYIWQCNTAVTTRQQIISHIKKVLRAAQHSEYQVVIISTVLNSSGRHLVNRMCGARNQRRAHHHTIELDLVVDQQFYNMTLTPDYTIGSNGLPNIINRRRCSIAMKLGNISNYSNISKCGSNKLLNKRGSAGIYLPVINNSQTTTTTAATIFRLECNDRRSHRSDKAAKDVYNQRLKELQANSCNRTARWGYSRVWWWLSSIHHKFKLLYFIVNLYY